MEEREKDGKGEEKNPYIFTRPLEEGRNVCPSSLCPIPPPPADLGEAGPTPDYSYFCCYRFLHALTHPVAAWFYKEETKHACVFPQNITRTVLNKEKHKEKMQ